MTGTTSTRLVYDRAAVPLPHRDISLYPSIGEEAFFPLSVPNPLGRHFVPSPRYRRYTHTHTHRHPERKLRWTRDAINLVAAYLGERKVFDMRSNTNCLENDARAPGSSVGSLGKSQSYQKCRKPRVYNIII